MSRTPSEIMRSNVRVGPLCYEPIDRWIERYPGLEDVLCFGSDYPHVEGGKNTHIKMSERLARLGPAVVEKFFVTNGAVLFA